MKNAFDKVVGEMCIIGLQKEKHPTLRHENVIEVLPYSRTSSFFEKERKFQKILQSRFDDLENNYMFTFFLTDELLAIKQKIVSIGQPFINFFDIVSYGLNIDDDAISDKKIDEKYVPAIRGKDIEPYAIKKIRWINYDPKLLTRDGDVSAFLQPKKIVAQRIGGKLVAVLDKDQIYCFNALNMFIPREIEISMLYTLGWYHSELIYRFMRVFILLNSDMTVNFTQGYLGKLPFALPKNDDQLKRIETTVRKIIDLKAINHRSQVETLQKQIDHEIYSIYGLSEREIQNLEDAELTD